MENGDGSLWWPNSHSRSLRHHNPDPRHTLTEEHKRRVLLDWTKEVLWSSSILYHPVANQRFQRSHASRKQRQQPAHPPTHLPPTQPPHTNTYCAFLKVHKRLGKAMIIWFSAVLGNPEGDSSVRVWYKRWGIQWWTFSVLYLSKKQDCRTLMPVAEQVCGVLEKNEVRVHG